MPKEKENVGTLIRSAYQLGASFVFTIGKRYVRQPTDTMNGQKHMPIFNFVSWSHFLQTMPDTAQIVPVDFGDGSVSVEKFQHPRECVYVLGAEDFGLPEEATQGRILLSIPSVRQASYNVAVAGSIVMYDRLSKLLT